MMKLFKLAAGLVLTAALAACGGGGGSPGTQVPGGGSGTTSTNQSGTTTTAPPTTTTSVVTPASIEVLTSANEVLSAGSQVLITAVVKNVNNVGMADQPVVFSANSGTLLAETMTNDDGVATARLSAGASKALRNITVSVTSGAASGGIVLPVTGTRFNLTGATSLKQGEPSTYTARLLDSSGNSISGAIVNVASSLGNALSSSTLVTSPNGDIQFVYTPNNTGTDTLVISGLGATATGIVGISSIDFIALSPPAGASVIVNTSQSITVQYRVANAPVSGVNVQFSTTRGQLSAPSVVTDGAGQASVSISSSSAGPASVVAQIAGVGQVTLPIQFRATTPASLVVQANPGAVLPNSSGSTNQSTLEAVVLDATGNAVADQDVTFTIDEDDGNGGTLSSPRARTDSNGRAQVQFISGAQATSTNGVKFSATVLGTSVVGTTSLTVNGAALFISIGFGNTISNLDETTYSKTFSVYVTDSNGNAVGNQIVTLSTIPAYYGKGQLRWTGVVWGYATYTECPNEDRNQNGRLDLGEDTNTNGQLTPGNPVVLAPGNVTTNSQGRATFTLQYGEQYVPWLAVNITAGARVSETESRSSLVFPLSGVSSDFSSETEEPAGVVSPFGTTQSCTSP